MANTYDLGAVTSYAIAVEHGYEGTEAQFAEELTGATAAARAAAEDASDAEAYAVGKRGGVDVGSTDPAYHNNAKYWAQNASGANLAQAFSTSTAYAVGDYVLYNNKLYRFTTAHSAGEWNSAQVTEVKTMDEVSSIKSDLSEQVGVFNWNKRCFIVLNTSPVNLTPVQNGGLDCIVLECVEGEKFIITASGGVQSRAWGFLDNNNYVLSVADENTQVNDLEITTPSNAVRLVINNKIIDGNGHVCKIGNNLESRVAELEKNGSSESGSFLNSGLGILLSSILKKVAWTEPSIDYVTNSLIAILRDTQPIDVIESVRYVPYNYNPYKVTGNSPYINKHLIAKAPDQSLYRISTNGVVPYNGYQVNALPGYELTVYEIKAIGFDSKYINNDFVIGDFDIVGGFGPIETNNQWTTSYQSSDSSIKYIFIKFRKANNELFSLYEYTHMYGTVYTITGNVPTVINMLSNVESGGWNPSGFLPIITEGEVNHITISKSVNTARCRTDYLPISKGVIKAKDGYSFTIYHINEFGVTEFEPNNYLKANGFPGYIKRCKIDSDCMFIALVFKKDDDANFTQQEINNAYGTIYEYEGGDKYDVI